MSFGDALAQERRARLAAERMLELKQSELFAANAELSRHALTLTGEIIEKREEVAEVQTVAAELRGENTRVLQDLKQANHAVDIAERRLWDSVETVEDGFAVFDRDDQMIAANAAYLSVFDGLEAATPGVTYRQIVGLMVEEGIVDTGDLSADEWRDQALARWQSDDLQVKTIRLWNGLFIKLVDRRSQNGDTVSLALNITDTIRREKQLEEARVRAEAANRAKSAFLAKMSHELRTPMNGVVGMADLLVETALDDEQKLFVDTIRSSGEALLELINDVLDFSKMEASKLVLHKEEFDLEQMLSEVLMLFQPAVLARDIELIIDYDMFLPVVFVGDPGRIRQILTNLVGNAVKFTASGHVLVRVVGTSENGEYRLHICVEDTGQGIPQDMVGHIFGEFNQVEDEKNRKFEGTGLGLAITKQLVELMDGNIWVDSVVDNGSNFGFQLTLPSPVGAVENSPQIPVWITRIALQSATGQSAQSLSKMLSGFEVEVVDITPQEPVAGGILRPGDVLLVDADRSRDCVQRAHQFVLEQGCNVPMLVIQNLQTGSNRPDIDGVTYLNKPVWRRSLIQALADISPPTIDDVQPAPPNIVPVMVSERKMRILAAEDNRTNRLVFSKLVGKLNIDLEFAENGAQAVEKWQSFQPDLIFMDISMPVMDGKEATRTIRNIEVEASRKRTRIVALTAHAMDGDDSEILKAGLDKYLTKPLRKPAIFEQIRAAVPEDAEPVFDETPRETAETVAVARG